MSVWRRLGNVARGKVRSWQRGVGSPFSQEVVDEVAQPPRPVADEEPVVVEAPTPVAAEKRRPKKRRL